MAAEAPPVDSHSRRGHPKIGDLPFPTSSADTWPQILTFYLGLCAAAGVGGGIIGGDIGDPSCPFRCLRGARLLRRRPLHPLAEGVRQRGLGRRRLLPHAHDRPPPLPALILALRCVPRPAPPPRRARAEAAGPPHGRGRRVREIWNISKKADSVSDEEAVLTYSHGFRFLSKGFYSINGVPAQAELFVSWRRGVSVSTGWHTGSDSRWPVVNNDCDIIQCLPLWSNSFRDTYQIRRWSSRATTRRRTSIRIRPCSGRSRWWWRCRRRRKSNVFLCVDWRTYKHQGESFIRWKLSPFFTCPSV